MMECYVIARVFVTIGGLHHSNFLKGGSILIQREQSSMGVEAQWEQAEEAEEVQRSEAEE